MAYYYNDLAARVTYPTAGKIALLHTAGAFVLLAFLIAHVYLTTTGETPTANLKAMITGWENRPAEAVAAPAPAPPPPPPATEND